MGKNKKNRLKSNQPKSDAEFAKENGLEKIAIRAQKNQNK